MKIGEWIVNLSNNTGAKNLPLWKKIYSVNRNREKTWVYINLLGLNFAGRINNLTEHKLILSEMEEVRSSGLWDAKYYISKYHPEMKKREALLYYVVEGFKHKEKPSKIFDVEKYCCPKNINPIIHFIHEGRYCLLWGFFKNEFPASEEIVNNYLEAKKHRQTKKAVYTCITNNYDSIEELNAFYYTDNSWDYICFTDDEENIKKGRIGIWEIRPLVYKGTDNSLNNRYHKLHPHIVLPEYDESVYIDANINIITPKFFDLVNNTDKDILLPEHSNRIDSYKEILWAKEQNFQPPETVDKLYEIIKNDGFPANYGMSENNIIYRKHKEPQIIEMMDEWWKYVSEYCKRDQTSFAYVFWKRGRKIEDYMFENTRIDYKNFCIFTHKKGWELCK